MKYLDKNQNLVCIHIKDIDSLEGKAFLTPKDLTLQTGVLFFQKNDNVQNHIHLPRSSNIKNTIEVLFIVEGCCEISIYDNEKNFIDSFISKTKDIVIFVSGGHGIRFIENTKILEIKQGPYLEEDDKTKF
jgi:hypothetical protein